MGNAVVHFEIHGPDREMLEKFYGELFGWHVTSMPEMNYGLIDTHGGGGINGGIAASQDGGPQQIFYVEASDLQATLDEAAALGATTVMPVMDIPGGPTIALFADKAGNVIGLVGSPDGEPQGVSDGDGAPIAWFEINGGDYEEQKRFYADLFGWTYQEMDNPAFSYAMIGTQAEYGCAGAISVSKEDDRRGITLWAEVPDLGAYLVRANELGAQTALEPTQTPGGPEVAMFVDPQGNAFGMYRAGSMG
ncbi:MAG TPA: VOC family protein [Actinomycetota bacterium]